MPAHEMPLQLLQGMTDIPQRPLYLGAVRTLEVENRFTRNRTEVTEHGKSESSDLAMIVRPQQSTRGSALPPSS